MTKIASILNGYNEADAEYEKAKKRAENATKRWEKRLKELE